MTEQTAQDARWRWAPLTVAGLAGLALLVAIAVAVPVFVNDDAFVYFNYAKNFALGRPFAYDPRNLPSEGFTSWVFLLLLVPCEFAGLNPMLAATLLNVAALGAAALGVARLCSRCSGAPAAPAAGLAFLLLAGADVQLRALAGLGLETLLSGAALLWLADGAVAVALAPAALAGEAHRPARAERRFFLLAFAAVLVRPENAAIGAALAAWLFWAGRAGGPNAGLGARVRLLRGALPACVLAAAWLLFKLWLFGDVFPTSYYRKLEPASAHGAQHVAEFLASEWLRLAAALAAAALAWLPLRALGPPAALRSAVAALGLVALANLLVFLNFEPLVGFGFRFLIGCRLAACAVPALIAAHLLPRATLAVCLAGALAFIAVSRGAEPDLRGEIEREFDRHAYLQIGRSLRSGLTNPEEITVVFGDAGAIPYALGSIFIDPNGLSEPAIARLFRLPDAAERRRRLADYLLAQHPDLVVLGYGRARENGRLHIGSNRHSPLREPDLSTPARLLAAGFRYACSARAYADLHFGVNPSSPHFAEVAGALRALCAGPIGYRLPGGLRLEHAERSVHFPPLGGSPEAAPAQQLAPLQPAPDSR